MSGKRPTVYIALLCHATTVSREDLPPMPLYASVGLERLKPRLTKRPVVQVPCSSMNFTFYHLPRATVRARSIRLTFPLLTINNTREKETDLLFLL